MIDRAEIEEVMAGAAMLDPDDPEGVDERNSLRRQAVEEWLDNHPEGNLPAGPQNKPAKQIILGDLHSYAMWERSGPWWPTPQVQ